MILLDSLDELLCYQMTVSVVTKTHELQMYLKKKKQVLLALRLLLILEKMRVASDNGNFTELV